MHRSAGARRAGSPRLIPATVRIFVCTQRRHRLRLLALTPQRSNSRVKPVPKLTLTLQERLLLANQLRILQCLEPNKDDYKTHIEIIENGYEYLYDRLTNALHDPPERDVAPEVHDVFNMFPCSFWLN